MTNLAHFTDIKRLKRTPYVEGHGRFAIDVVGESNYQDNLEAICGPKTRHGVDKNFHARLIPEDDNPYDNLAVRVEIDGKTVGYLGKAVAREYRLKLSEAGIPGREIACQANVRGGWKREGGDEGHYGVWLDLPVNGRRSTPQAQRETKTRIALSRRGLVVGRFEISFMVLILILLCILTACLILGQS